MRKRFPTGCPIEVPVQERGGLCATGLGLYQSSVSKPTSFVIETTGQPADSFDVIISGPGSTAVPVRCYQQKDGNLLAEFIPNIIGLYIYLVYNWKLFLGLYQVELFNIKGI